MRTKNQLIIWLAGTIIFLMLIYLLRSILLPFVAGFAIAYLLDPINDKIESWGFSRGAATTVLTLTFFIVTIALTILAVPVIYEQLIGLIEEIPDYVNRIRDASLPIISLLMESIPFVSEKNLSSNAEEWFSGNYTEVVVSTLLRVLGGGIAAFNIISLLLITPVVSFYLLRDWDKILVHLNGLLPKKYHQQILKQFQEINLMLAKFVRGQAILCIVLGIIYGTFLSLIGLDFGLIIGLLSGLLSFIPFLGIFIGLFISLLVSVLQVGIDFSLMAMILGIFVIGQVLESSFLQPRFLGSRVELHPVWIIFGILSGGALFGFVGVLIAVPVTAIIGVLTRSFLGNYKSSQFYLGSNNHNNGNDDR